MKKKLFLICLFSLFIFFSPRSSLALKKRVWRPVSSSSGSGGSPSISAKLSADRQNIILSFRNVTATTSVGYELTYIGNDLEQGIFGSVSPSEGNAVGRTIYFGTCSKNHCTPHKNLKNGVLAITYHLKSGSTSAKKYRIRF
ncbi:MAG: hypothetical protein WC686_00305 [Candidatus Shapirobacteria bacterium]